LTDNKSAEGTLYMSTNKGYLTPWQINKLEDIAEWKEAMIL
jgi:hypothetical protein